MRNERKHRVPQRRQCLLCLPSGYELTKVNGICDEARIVFGSIRQEAYGPSPSGELQILMLFHIINLGPGPWHGGQTDGDYAKMQRILHDLQ